MCTTFPQFHKITTIIRASWGYAQERATQVTNNKTFYDYEEVFSDSRVHRPSNDAKCLCAI